MVLLWIAGFYLLIRYGIPLVRTTLQLLKYPLSELVDAQPAHWPDYSTLETVAVAELEALGFVAIRSYTRRLGPIEYQGVFFRHETRPVYASMDLITQVTTSYVVGFYSLSRDGIWFVTSNRQNYSQPLPKTDHKNFTVDTLDAHFEAHWARVRALTLETPADDEIYARFWNYLQQDFEQAKNKSVCLRAHPGQWYPGVNLASTIAFAMVFRKHRSKQPYQSPLTTGPDRSAYFAQCYRTIMRLQEAEAYRPLPGLVLFLVSFVVSFLLWGVQTEWQFAVIIMIVLSVHEMGHAVAMRAFGYQRIQMYFVPFVGAFVTGKVKNIAAWKQAVILFAGPLPGIMVTVVFALHPYLLFQHRFVMLLLAAVLMLNAYNLLPIVPLDGGRIVELTFQGRAWLAKGALSVAAMILLALLGYHIHDKALFIFNGFFALLLYGQWTHHRLSRAWGGTPGDDADLERLFEVSLQRNGPGPFLKHYARVRAVFVKPVTNAPSGTVSVLILLALVASWGVTGWVGWTGYGYHQHVRQFKSDLPFYHGTRHPGAEQAQRLTQERHFIESRDRRDPVRVDLAVIDADQTTTSARAEMYAGLLRQGYGGWHYSLKQIAGRYVNAVSEQVECVSASRCASMLEAALAWVQELGLDDYRNSFHAKMKLIGALFEADEPGNAHLWMERLARQWEELYHDSDKTARFMVALDSSAQGRHDGNRRQKQDGMDAMRALVATLKPDDALRVDWAMQEMSDDTDERKIPKLAALLRQKRAGRNVTANDIGDAYLDSVGRVIRTQPLKTRIRTMETALALVDETVGTFFSDTLDLRLQLAAAYDDAGRKDEAKRLLLALREKTHGYGLTIADAAQVWFYLRHRQVDDALAFLADPARTQRAWGDPNALGVAYAWALLDSGRLPEALARMEVVTKDGAANTLDLAYLYHRLGREDDARRLIARTDRACDPEEDYQSWIPWQQERKQALQDMQRLFCATSSKR